MRGARTAYRTAREAIKMLHEAFAELPNGVLQYVLLDLQHYRPVMVIKTIIISFGTTTTTSNQ